MKYSIIKDKKLKRPKSSIIMGRVKITRDGFFCERCKHMWIPKKKVKPRVCPKCKSPYWDVPKKNKKR